MKTRIVCITAYFAAIFVLLAIFAPHARGVPIDLTPAQEATVCAAHGGCGTVTPPGPGTPACGVGQHLQGNVCVPDAPPTPTPPGGWDGSQCTGYGKTVILDIPWVGSQRVYTGYLAVNDIVVVRFTTGNADSADNNLPRVDGAEWGSPGSTRVAVLSDTPCSFTPMALAGIQNSFSPAVPFAVGAGKDWGYYPSLKKNTPYFFNVRTLPNESCSAQNYCDMFFELLKPSGL